jgi:hypothetical protein
MQSGRYTLPDHTASYATWRVLYQPDRLLCQYMWPSAPLCTATNSKQSHSFQTLCPRRKILLWRMTPCRRVSCRLVQAFRRNTLSPSPVLDNWILIRILARLWILCPNGWTDVRLLSSTVRWTSLHPSLGDRTTSFPTTGDSKKWTSSVWWKVVFWLMYSLCSLSVSVTTQCNYN